MQDSVTPPAHTDAIPRRLAATSAPDDSTFAPGLRLLPRSVRADVYRLYHVLRSLDDLVDEDRPEAGARVAAVERWVLAGVDAGASTPETRLLARLAQHHRLPEQALLQFCQAMRDDVARTPIDSEADLERYCQHAGGSVGVMLVRLLGARHADAERRMALLGRAVQRTNILRDIDEDRARGRVYIARSTVERFGEPLPGARETLLRDQIARAEALYEQADGATYLLAHGRRGMALCAELYRELLRQIAREGYGARPGRVIVPTWRRRLLLVRCCIGGEHRPVESPRDSA